MSLHINPMERETNTITTPAGKELIIKTYLTARERNELRDIFAAQMKMDVSNGKVLGSNEISGELLAKAEKKLLGLMIVSYAGSNENVYERLGDELPAEYDFVVAECNKAEKGNFQTAK